MYVSDQFTSELYWYLVDDTDGYEVKFDVENFETIAWNVEKGMSSNVGWKTFIQGKDHIDKTMVNEFIPPPGKPLKQ